MDGAAVSFDLREIDGLAAKLNKAKLSTQDRAVLLRSIGAEVEAQTQERFDTQTDPEGNPWKALAQKTKDYYIENGFGGGSLLVKSGGLRDSVESQVSSWSVLVGATKIYAAIHQWGGDIVPKTAPALFVPGYGRLKKVTIPARPYVGISSNNAAEIAIIVQQFIAGRIT
ncbi:MAG: phage virion morphogenesis protein [Treponema sp.]|jgi:phage virion morphogenesis protein|nr:phage virion morphogenesis protein [Treponema sp.]